MKKTLKNKSQIAKSKSLVKTESYNKSNKLISIFEKSFKTVNLVSHGNWVEVILNRPEVKNAFNPAMISELTEIFKTTEKTNPELRALLLKGSGTVFCAGADLKWMQEMVNYSLAENKKDSVKLFEMFESLANLSIPVIGEVVGAAFGGALGLIAACDYVICDKNALLCFSEVKLGIAPAVISSFVLNKCELGKASPYMISAKVFNAEMGYNIGLIHEVVSGDELSAHSSTFVNQILTCGPEAVKETKNLLKKVKSSTWSKQKALTTQVIAKRRVSAEGQEGLKSFLEKRKPNWSI